MIVPVVGMGGQRHTSPSPSSVLTGPDFIYLLLDLGESRLEPAGESCLVKEFVIPFVFPRVWSQVVK